MSENQYSPLSNYDFLLKTPFFERITGYSATTLLKWENQPNPIVSPIRSGNSQNEDQLRKFYTISDLLSVYKHAGKKMPSTKSLCIAVWNSKGGVGKSTFVQHLGTTFSLIGLKTLLIDLDPQADLTMLMGAEQQFSDVEEDPYLQPTIRDAIGYIETTDDGKDVPRVVPIKETIKHLSPTLSIIPSDDDLSHLDYDLWVPQAEIIRNGVNVAKLVQLELQMNEIKNDYDVIIMDCAPNRNILNLNAIWCADTLLVPVELEAKCLHSVKSVSRWLQQMIKMHSQFQSSIVLVPNKYKTNQTISRLAYSKLHEIYGETILSNIVFPMTTVVDHCASLREPIFQFATRRGKPYSSSTLTAKRISNLFWQLAHELLQYPVEQSLFDIDGDIE